jgi:hypothetical protein
MQIASPEMPQDEELRAAFRRRLRDALRGQKKGIAAEDAEIDPTTLSRWISEESPREPGLFAIKRLADRLSTNVGQLLGEVEAPSATAEDREAIGGFVSWASRRFGIAEGSKRRRSVTTQENVLEFVPFKPKLQIIEEEEFRFMVKPQDFKQKDFDYPQPWHYWTNDTPIEELPAAAAGPVGVPGLLNPHGANVREVFDRVNQIVRVFGDSMEDRYFDGDLVRVDTRIRTPLDGTPVAVYCDDLGGSLIGFLKRDGDHVLLKKKNRTRYPEPIMLPSNGWILVGPIVELVSRRERREIL